MMMILNNTRRKRFNAETGYYYLNKIVCRTDMYIPKRNHSRTNAGGTITLGTAMDIGVNWGRGEGGQLPP
jgi:hypothetical protein